MERTPGFLWGKLGSDGSTKTDRSEALPLADTLCGIQDGIATAR